MTKFIASVVIGNVEFEAKHDWTWTTDDKGRLLFDSPEEAKWAAEKFVIEEKLYKAKIIIREA